MSTHVRKSKSGWEASTECPIPGHPYKFLTVKTYKRESGGLLTIASVAEHADGFKRHLLFQDFHMTLVFYPYARCTEANVRAQHSSEMAHLADVMAKVISHYSKETEVAF